MATVRESFNPVSPMECAECGRYLIPVEGITDYGSLMVCTNIFCSKSVTRYDIDNPVELQDEINDAAELYAQGLYNMDSPEPALKKMKENAVQEKEPLPGRKVEEENNDSGLMRFIDDNTPG